MWCSHFYNLAKLGFVWFCSKTGFLCHWLSLHCQQASRLFTPTWTRSQTPSMDSDKIGTCKFNVWWKPWWRICCRFIAESISERIVIMVQHLSKLSMDAKWCAVFGSNSVLIIISISECWFIGDLFCSVQSVVKLMRGVLYCMMKQMDKVT